MDRLVIAKHVRRVRSGYESEEDEGSISTTRRPLLRRPRPKPVTLTSTTRPPITSSNRNISSPVGEEMGEDPSLQAGVIAGIVIGVLILLVLSALLYVFVSRKRTLSQRHMTSFKTTFALAQRIAGNKADYSSNKHISVIGSKENDPEYQDTAYAELGDVQAHVNYVYSRSEESLAQQKPSLVSARRRPLPNAPEENSLDVTNAAISDVDVNILPNISDKAYSPKLMHSSDHRADEPEVIVTKTLLSEKNSTTSEEDNTATVVPRGTEESRKSPTPSSPSSTASVQTDTMNLNQQTCSSADQPTSDVDAKPVRSHPPLRRHANFNYKPPEATKQGRRALIPAVKEEDEEGANSTGYGKVWVSQKPKLRRGARSSVAGQSETNWDQLRED